MGKLGTDDYLAGFSRYDSKKGKKGGKDNKKGGGKKSKKSADKANKKGKKNEKLSASLVERVNALEHLIAQDEMSKVTTKNLSEATERMQSVLIELSTRVSSLEKAQKATTTQVKNIAKAQKSMKNDIEAVAGDVADVVEANAEESET